MTDRQSSSGIEFTQIEWLNETTRQLWESKIDEAAIAWKKIEIMSVAKRLRDAALLVCTPEDMVTLPRRMAFYDLAVVPLAGCAPIRHYQSRQVAADPQARMNYRAVVARLDIIDQFAAAWDNGDDDRIGVFLGFPQCCRAAFLEIWNHHRKMDPTWDMAIRSKGVAVAAWTEVKGHDEANLLLRWFGIRAVPHLPCSFDCDFTMRAGRAFLRLGVDLGLGREVATIREMLSWPVQWCAFQQRAEVDTPIAKMITSTDATEVKRTVRRNGFLNPLPRHLGNFEGHDSGNVAKH